MILALVIDGAQLVGGGILCFLAGWLAAQLSLPRGAAGEGGEAARLADRIASYLAGTGRPLTAREIAREIGARHADVLHALRSDGRFERSSAAPERHPSAIVYHPAFGAREHRGTPILAKRRETHDERVLRLLSDGRPHTHLELYRLGVVAHSRVASLRRKGYRIACWREGRSYVYQLGREEAA